MKQVWKRTPKNYSGKRLTSHHLKDVLDYALTSLSTRMKDNPEAILASWARIVGPKIAPFTRPIRFEEGVLYVAVKNSTLLSLLSQRDKPMIVQALRRKFPDVEVRGIVFKLG